MHDERQWGQATKAIRAGLRVDPTTRALNTPIYETTTFAYEDMASYERISAAALAWQPDNFFYSRTQNPTTAALERKIAALEGTEDAAITACGMGAVNTGGGHRSPLRHQVYQRPRRCPVRRGQRLQGADGSGAHYGRPPGLSYQRL